MTLCDGADIGVADLGLAPGGDAADRAGEAGPAGLDEELDSVEKQRILDALEQSRWNKTAAARLLGLNFGALRYRMQKLGIE